MRTSNKGSRTGMGGTLSILIAGTLAVTAVAATTASVSQQDIASLANIRTADTNRWLAHLVSVPSGSNHLAAVEGKTSFSTKTISHTQAVQTAENIHLLGQGRSEMSGGEAHINRAMMGDRVFKPKPMKVALSTEMLLTHDSLITGSVGSPKASANKLIAKAQTFNAPTLVAVEPTIVVAKLTPETSKTLSVSKGQMNQARAAAREMAQVAAKVQRGEIIVAGNPAIQSSVSAYAAENTQMASAFAAVLRPSLRKSITKPVAKPTMKPAVKSSKKTTKKKSTFKKAVAAMKRSRKRSIIRLARGDHKWAAKALPRSSYSRNQRRCLATGVYFEARSESRKGQQAVAQVILNRVKNPTYPNSICGVVYQNKWKRNACQFSFACDGIRDRVNSKKHWRKSVKVANDAIDGRVWLRAVGSSSHYHADYVWPRWRKSMRKMVKIGRHIFYRTYGGGWS
ncbi:MAG: cell wall hydrolase [Rhizobiaceae bacterium]